MEVEINGKVGGNLPAPCTYHLSCYYYYYYYYYLSCVTIVIRDCNYPGTGQLLPQHSLATEKETSIRPGASQLSVAHNWWGLTDIMSPARPNNMGLAVTHSHRWQQEICKTQTMNLKFANWVVICWFLAGNADRQKCTNHEICVRKRDKGAL